MSYACSFLICIKVSMAKPWKIGEVRNEVSTNSQNFFSCGVCFRVLFLSKFLENLEQYFEFYIEILNLSARGRDLPPYPRYTTSNEFLVWVLAAEHKFWGKD